MSAIKCPICKSDAKALPHTIDVEGFGCPTHDKFNVARGVIREMRDRTRGQWEGALIKAKVRAAAQGGLPCILSHDFVT